LRGDPVVDDVDLLRIAFHPADFDTRTGRLKDSHFRRGELLAQPGSDGKPGYVSVNRRDRLMQAEIDHVIHGMTKDGQREKRKRHEDRFAVLSCQDVWESEAPQGIRPFAVKDETEENNAAHCGIHNVAELPPEEELDAYVDDLRTALGDAVRTVETYTQTFPTEAAEAKLPAGDP